MKTKLVVINENMLGYIHPLQPDVAGILRSSVLRGATHHENDGVYQLTGATVRLASERDFEQFRVVFTGYKNNPNEYEFAA